MRLLSFLTDIERSIRMEANADETSIWNSARIVNFKTGLARLTLVSKEADSGMPEGTILAQQFHLANGSFCMKVSLNWKDCNRGTILSVYETPTLNWKLEASRIAADWLAGPPPAPVELNEGATHFDRDRIAIAG